MQPEKRKGEGQHALQKSAGFSSPLLQPLSPQTDIPFVVAAQQGRPLYFAAQVSIFFPPYSQRHQFRMQV